MRINILTIFPDMFKPLRESMLGRAVSNGIIEFNIVDVRDFSLDKHKKTDDYPFGGGQGMVFMPQPAFDALRGVGADRTRNIYMSPRGRVLDMSLAIELADYLTGADTDSCSGSDLRDAGLKDSASVTCQENANDLTIFCGHYEGIDQRIIDYWKMEEVSIGDYILTGGELAAMVLVDAVLRLIPGVLGEEMSAMDESIYSGLLEYPHYTQPREFGDDKLSVPEVILSGNHKEIALWRFRQSVRITRRRRPDIFREFLKNHSELSKDELKVLLDETNKREFELLKKNLTAAELKCLERIISSKNNKKLL